MYARSFTCRRPSPLPSPSAGLSRGRLEPNWAQASPRQRQACCSTFPKGEGPAGGRRGRGGPIDPKFPARSPNFSKSQAHNPVAQHQQNKPNSPAHPVVVLQPVQGSQGARSDGR